MLARRKRGGGFNRGLLEGRLGFFPYKPYNFRSPSATHVVGKTMGNPIYFEMYVVFRNENILWLWARYLKSRVPPTNPWWMTLSILYHHWKLFSTRNDKSLHDKRMVITEPKEQKQSSSSSSRSREFTSKDTYIYDCIVAAIVFQIYPKYHSHCQKLDSEPIKKKR